MGEQVEVIERAAELLKAGKRVALCTIVEKIGSGPAELGRVMLVTEDGQMVGTIGGGECFERVLKQEALKALKEGKPKSMKFSFHGGAREGELDTGLWCGGTITAFVDVIKPKLKLVIVGSGHIALPTYYLADLLGFEVTIVDDNEDTLTEKRFPNARLVFNEDFERALKGVKVDERTYVAIVHGEPKHDLAALRRFIRERVAYLGLLGSKTKIAKLKGLLQKEGVPEEAVGRIRAPIGLDIGAETPEEIAVSIAAELIKERR